MKDVDTISKNSPPEHAGRAWASDFDRIVAEGMINELCENINKFFPAENPTQLAKRLEDDVILKDIDQGGAGMTSIQDATKEAPNPAPLDSEKK